jgi:pimeloyl-ACP methyl ester carboxylesterase
MGMMGELLQTCQPVPISVVLVHGTWASGSTWPLLEAEIRRAFGAADVAIHYLKWSGRNTVSARVSAAEKLSLFLEADRQHRPSARRFIVAHSHGGAVALLGTRDAALRQAVDGVICLSTPFLLVRPRRFSELGTSVATFGVVLSLVLVTIGAALIARSIVPLVLGPALAWGARAAAVRGASRSRSFIERVSLPNVTGFPLLIVRAPDDEASLSLGLMQATNRLVWLVWRVVGLYWVALLWNAALRLADRLQARTILERAAELWIIAVISSFVAAVLVGKYTAQEYPPYAFLVLSAPVYVMLLTILVAALLTIPIGVINALALLPFGPGYSIFSPFIEVSAESTPPGVCTVVQLSWGTLSPISEAVPPYRPGGTGWMDRTVRTALGLWNQVTSSAIRLQHSETYADPLAIATVVKWMQDPVSARRF